MYIQNGNIRVLQETVAPRYTKGTTEGNASGEAKQSKQPPYEEENQRLEKASDENRKREDALEFALNSTRKSEYSLVGADSDLASLDIAKAISDMQKDSILQEYQYFVRSGM